MSEQDDDQRRDALLLALLKTPPTSRAQLQEELRRAREAKRANALHTAPVRRESKAKKA